MHPAAEGVNGGAEAATVWVMPTQTVIHSGFPPGKGDLIVFSEKRPPQGEIVTWGLYFILRRPREKFSQEEKPQQSAAAHTARANRNGQDLRATYATNVENHQW